MLARANSTNAAGTGGTSSSSANAVTPTSRFGTHFGYLAAYDSGLDTEHSSLNEEEEAIGDEEEDQVWGLEKGMELFEVSSKDDTGKREMSS
jgi:hypothetical protein